MKQVARRLRDGSLELVEVPDPSPPPGMVAVKVEASVISSGTERATLEVARKGLLAKARARPDQARQVIERARREGIRSTFALVRERLDQLGPLGYSAAGRALAIGEGVRGISAGDRVAIAGAGFANHAEVDLVPALLCAAIPEGVTSEEAAFATVGAIALNGFRLGETQVGGTVAVIGLGLIGQLAVRVARAAGCRVFATDLDTELLDLAAAAGADVAVRSELREESAWAGAADSVLICASAGSSDPVELAALLARDRGIVVVVGDVKMELPRGPYYDKELQLRLARSYGPGRYDPEYELHGTDYPIGHVRWTEQRNLEAFLQLLADGRISPGELVSHRFDFSDAEQAFASLLDPDQQTLALMLRYEDREPPPARASEPLPRSRRQAAGKHRFALIGAGNFATTTIIPGLLDAGLEPALVASASGLTAAGVQRRFGFEAAIPSIDEALGRSDIDLVVIATPHNTHAALVERALRAGKAVYVEKPLALDESELAAVEAAVRESAEPLLVGFNRRHSPLAAELKQLGGPRLMSYRVNAGRLAPKHWTNDLRLGGGRLKGEGCHFVDFLCDQAGADPVSVTARGFGSTAELPLAATDNFSLQIGFSDGSVGSLHYAADAPPGPGKERFEVTAPGAYAVIDDFRRATIRRGNDVSKLGGSRQNKGFAAQYAWLARILKGEAEAPSPDSFVISTLATLAAARSLASGLGEPIVDGSQLSLP